MIGIIITGHGRFSEGMISSIDMIAGKTESLMGVNFLETESTDDLDKHLLDAYTELMSKNDGVIIVCDLYGGSPFKSSATLSNSKENIAVLAGINLASCLELIFARIPEDSASKLADVMLAKDSNRLMKFELPLRTKKEETEDGI